MYTHILTRLPGWVQQHPWWEAQHREPQALPWDVAWQAGKLSIIDCWSWLWNYIAMRQAILSTKSTDWLLKINWLIENCLPELLITTVFDCWFIKGERQAVQRNQLADRSQSEGRRPSHGLRSTLLWGCFLVFLYLISHWHNRLKCKLFATFSNVFSATGTISSSTAIWSLGWSKSTHPQVSAQPRWKC